MYGYINSHKTDKIDKTYHRHADMQPGTVYKNKKELGLHESILVEATTDTQKPRIIIQLGIQIC